jgi:hypothetical protein
MTVRLASADGRLTPYLRVSTSRDTDGVPEGWVAEAAGTWSRGEAEVVYDPRRYDVMISDGLGDDGTEAALRDSGWVRCAVDDRRSLWARDRVLAAQQALTRSEIATAGPVGPAGVEHPQRRPAPSRGIGL